MRFILIDEKRLENCIDYLSKVHLDGKTEVVFQAYKSSRSLAQNRLLWMWYGVISEYTGHDPEELHEMTKAKYFGLKKLKTKDANGNIINLSVPNGGTSKLSVDDMARFLQAIEVLAFSLDMVLPRPDDYYLAMKGRIE